MNHFFTTPVGRFRLIAFLEGISLLVLVIIGMPLKYMAHKHGVVESIGPIHGFLFIVYCIMAVYFAVKQKWGIVKTGLILFASFIPFGTFIIDHKILRKL